MQPLAAEPVSSFQSTLSFDRPWYFTSMGNQKAPSPSMASDTEAYGLGRIGLIDMLPKRYTQSAVPTTRRAQTLPSPAASERDWKKALREKKENDEQIKILSRRNKLEPVKAEPSKRTEQYGHIKEKLDTNLEFSDLGNKQELLETSTYLKASENKELALANEKKSSQIFDHRVHSAIVWRPGASVPNSHTTTCSGDNSRTLSAVTYNREGSATSSSYVNRLNERNKRLLSNGIENSTNLEVIPGEDRYDVSMFSKVNDKSKRREQTVAIGSGGTRGDIASANSKFYDSRYFGSRAETARVRLTNPEENYSSFKNNRKRTVSAHVPSKSSFEAFKERMFLATYKVNPQPLSNGDTIRRRQFAQYLDPVRPTENEKSALTRSKSLSLPNLRTDSKTPTNNNLSGVSVILESRSPSTKKTTSANLKVPQSNVNTNSHGNNSNTSLDNSNELKIFSSAYITSKLEFSPSNSPRPNDKDHVVEKRSATQGEDRPESGKSEKIDNILSRLKDETQKQEHSGQLQKLTSSSKYLHDSIDFNLLVPVAFESSKNNDSTVGDQKPPENIQKPKSEVSLPSVGISTNRMYSWLDSLSINNSKNDYNTRNFHHDMDTPKRYLNENGQHHSWDDSSERMEKSLPLVEQKSFMSSSVPVNLNKLGRGDLPVRSILKRRKRVHINLGENRVHVYTPEYEKVGYRWAN